MKTAQFSIWLPSIQQYVGFGRFTTKHQLELAQSVELDRTGTSFDFDSNFARVVTDLSAGVVNGFDINAFDKFAIALQLATMYVGDTNHIHHECEACSSAQETPVRTMIKYTVSDVMQKLQPIIDKNPSRMLTSNNDNVAINIDVLPTAQQLLIHNYAALEHDITNVEMFGWIRAININMQPLDVSQMDIAQARKLFDVLSISMLQKNTKLCTGIS